MNSFNQATKKNSSRVTRSNTKTLKSNKSSESAKMKTSSTKLPRSLLASWEHCLIANGRFPRGTRKTQENSLNLIRKLILGEAESVYKLNESIDKGEVHRLESFLKTKKGLVGYLLSAHLDQLLNNYHLLERVGRKWKWKYLLNQFEAFKITDWASNTGASAGVWLDLLLRNKAAQESIQVNLFERNSMFLEGALEILQHLAPGANTQISKKMFIQSDKFQTPSQLNIHSLSFTWPYFKYNKKDLSAFMKQMDHEILENKASIVSLLDLPSKEAARDLMLLRNQLVELGYKAVYPCPAGVRSCPMLLEAKDWCYSEFDYEPTFIQKSLQRELGIQKPMAKSTAFLFASPKLLEVLEPSWGTARVVGRPKKKVAAKAKKSSNQEFEYLMCTEEGLKKYPSKLTQTRIARRGWDMHVSDQS